MWLHGKDCFKSCHRVFTYVYSLLIEKDICDHQNVSVKLLCQSSGGLFIFSVRVSSFFSYCCYPYFGTFLSTWSIYIFEQMHCKLRSTNMEEILLRHDRSTSTSRNGRNITIEWISCTHIFIASQQRPKFSYLIPEFSNQLDVGVFIDGRLVDNVLRSVCIAERAECLPIITVSWRYCYITREKQILI